MSFLNVFRRHEAPSEQMFHFYGEVLGFAQLGTYQLGNGGVTRFRVGGSELKFTGRSEEDVYISGGMDAATGVRLLGFFFADSEALLERFAADGLQLPVFKNHNGRTSALVQDPDGQWVELIIVPNQEEDFYLQIEIGLSVSDLAASRQFYGEFMGLQALPAETAHLTGSAKQAYRLGNTIISLHQFAQDLPADTGSGGVQYVVNDALAVQALADQQGIVKDQDAYVLEGFNMYFLWLRDPDGITNYFAQSGAIP